MLAAEADSMIWCADPGALLQLPLPAGLRRALAAGGQRGRRGRVRGGPAAGRRHHHGLRRPVRQHVGR